MYTGHTRKPWRKKPADWLRYWTGKPDRRTQVKTVIAYCLWADGQKRCGHSAVMKIADLPDWDWADISAHMRCTVCGHVGYVDFRANWSDVIDPEKPASEAGKE